MPGRHLIRARRRILSGTPPPWAVNGITTAETTWMSIHLDWANAWGQRQPLLLQRREDTNFEPPDLSAPQSYANFIWLGQGPSVTRYTDLFPYTEAGKTFYYRVTAVLNLPAVAKTGANPQFGDWLTGVGTLAALPVGWTVIDATGAPYNVVADDATNNWAGLRAAASAANAAGGGVVQLPVGTIRCWPTDVDVQWNGTRLYMDPGDTAATSFLNGQLSNVVLRGNLDGNGNPTTKLNMRLWYDQPATNYLVVLNTPAGDPSNDADIDNIRRYGFWEQSTIGTDVENVQALEVEVDMTATPVNTGFSWYSLQDKREQWDISQKGFYSHGRWRNRLLQDVTLRNCRGEMVYAGGFNGEKIKMVRCTLKGANSSITSGSFASEYESCDLSDAANALIESSVHSLAGDDGGAPMISVFGLGRRFYHDTIVRNLAGKCMDLSAGGVMVGLPGNKVFAGIQIFNQKDTFQTVSDCVVEGYRSRAFGPWYECEDGFIYNNVWKSTGHANVVVFDFRPAVNGSYQLSGGMENFWLLKNRIELSYDMQAPLVYVQTSLDAMNDTVLEQLHLAGNGFPQRVVWQDVLGAALGRDGFALIDWTLENTSTNASTFIQDLTVPWGDGTSVGARILPTFTNVNFFEQVRTVTASDDRFRLQWNRHRLRSDTADNDFYVRPVNLSLCPVGQEFELKADRPADVMRLAADGAWNTFTGEQVVPYGMTLTVRVVDAGGIRKLEKVSLV